MPALFGTLINCDGNQRQNRAQSDENNQHFPDYPDDFFGFH